jgi:hypothetical protein
MSFACLTCLTRSSDKGHLSSRASRIPDPIRGPRSCRPSRPGMGKKTEPGPVLLSHPGQQPPGRVHPEAVGSQVAWAPDKAGRRATPFVTEPSKVPGRHQRYLKGVRSRSCNYSHISESSQAGQAPQGPSLVFHISFDGKHLSEYPLRPRLRLTTCLPGLPGRIGMVAVRVLPREKNGSMPAHRTQSAVCRVERFC